MHAVESELAGLRAELEQMKLGMSERDARDRARDALLRACTDSLGLTTPPLPAPHTVAEKIAGLRRAARVARSVPAPAHALRQRHAREVEELKREHNDLLLGALRTHNARALTTATKAVRRELCLLVHPDKASRFASARLMGEAVMQRLGELAQ